MVDFKRFDPYDMRSSLYRDKYGSYGNGDDRARLSDLNGEEALVVFSSVLTDFENQLEEAKLRYSEEEDEGDSATLGEYMALKSVVEQLKKFLGNLPMQEYSKGQLQSTLKKSPGYDQYLHFKQRF